MQSRGKIFSVGTTVYSENDLDKMFRFFGKISDILDLYEPGTPFDILEVSSSEDESVFPQRYPGEFMTKSLLILRKVPPCEYL